MLILFILIIFVFLFPTITIIYGQEQQKIDNNDPSIYTNMVISWQRRILYCAPSKNGRNSGQCYLTVGKDGQLKPAKCHEETVQLTSGETDVRTLCNIECRGADRDSVISKVPSWTRECIRYFTYDTAREPLPKQFGGVKREWHLWRGGRCRLMEISLEVHCGFP